jgi:hypothetical protein
MTARTARVSRRAIRALAAALGAVLAIGSFAATSPPVVRAGELPWYCRRSADPVPVANDLMANRYTLQPHPTVTLPADPRWTENPLRDSNWQSQFHSLRFTLDLLGAWQVTGTTAYRDRALFLVRDWYEENPRSDPPSRWSWHNGSTAWRSVVLACTADVVPMTTWLRNALVLHGRVLADPDFYVNHGNHALNQAMGLLEVGRVLGRSDWITLAEDRINTLVVESVDTQGVTNEQSVAYPSYNYKRYSTARRRLEEMGQPLSSAFDRVALMPRFLVQARLPTGQFESLGDADMGIPAASPALPDPPPALVASYKAGFLFARSGLGTTRAYPDETFLSVRWGPGTRFHGHPDGTALTLAAWGTRLLVDPGKYSYTASKWRTFFKSRRAHNVVTVDGLAWDTSRPTDLVSRTIGPAVVDIRLRANGYRGVGHVRRITWSRNLDYLIVEDRLTSSTRRTYRQLWHFTEDANLATGTVGVRTRRTTGNVMIRQLVGTPRFRVVTGATDPVQGWISYHYGKRKAAPVVEVIRTGASVRYLTLIVPARGRPLAQVSSLRLTSDGYRLTVTIDGRSERVVATGPTISVTPITGG